MKDKDVRGKWEYSRANTPTDMHVHTHAHPQRLQKSTFLTKRR